MGRAGFARWFVLGGLITLIACSGAAPTPTVDAPATQTRTSELANVASATAPASTAEASAIPVEPTAAPLMPTATGLPSTATTAQATPPSAPPTGTPATSSSAPASATATVRIVQAPPLITKDQTGGQFGPVDAREIGANPGSYDGKRVIFTGTLRLIRVADQGQAFPIGDYRTSAYAQVLITSGPGGDAGVTVFVLYNGDTAGMVEGSTVAFFALGVGTYSFQNASGGTITQALFYAQYAELLD